MHEAVAALLELDVGVVKTLEDDGVIEDPTIEDPTIGLLDGLLDD